MKTLLGQRGGLFALSDHARTRIEQRFGVIGEAEQALWLVEQLGTATLLTCAMSTFYVNAPRIIWYCADYVRIISDGNEIITVWREGEPDSEELIA